MILRAGRARRQHGRADDLREDLVIWPAALAVVPAVVEQLLLAAARGRRGRPGAGHVLPQPGDLALEVKHPPPRLARALEFF